MADDSDLEEKLMQVAFSEIQETSPEIFAKLGRTLRDGEILFKEGDTSNELVMIVSGMCKISKVMGNQERVLAVLKSGDILGEMSHFDDAPRSATATAVGTLNILAFDRDNFGMIFELHHKWTLYLIQAISQRVYGTFERLISAHDKQPAPPPPPPRPPVTPETESLLEIDDLDPGGADMGMEELLEVDDDPVDEIVDLEEMLELPEAPPPPPPPPPPAPAKPPPLLAHRAVPPPSAPKPPPPPPPPVAKAPPVVKPPPVTPVTAIPPPKPPTTVVKPVPPAPPVPKITIPVPEEDDPGLNACSFPTPSEVTCGTPGPRAGARGPSVEMKAGSQIRARSGSARPHEKEPTMETTTRRNGSRGRPTGRATALPRVPYPRGSRERLDLFYRELRRAILRGNSLKVLRAEAMRRAAAVPEWQTRVTEIFDWAESRLGQE